MKLFSLVIYVVLQVLCLPLLIVGVLLATYRQMVVSKRLGLSQTAIEVIQARWTMDRFGIRSDPGTVRLTNVLPNLYQNKTPYFMLWALSKMLDMKLFRK